MVALNHCALWQLKRGINYLVIRLIIKTSLEKQRTGAMKFLNAIQIVIIAKVPLNKRTLSSFNQHFYLRVSLEKRRFGITL